MRQISTRTITLIPLLTVALAGCATSKDELLPHGQATMLDVWSQHTATGSLGTARQLLDARLTLRRPLIDPTGADLSFHHSYTRTAQSEIERQFRRIPNPDLVMYVFPHLAGSEQVPVPGYTTIFPLHERVQYAMPGERIEDY